MVLADTNLILLQNDPKLKQFLPKLQQLLLDSVVIKSEKNIASLHRCGFPQPLILILQRMESNPTFAVSAS